MSESGPQNPPDEVLVDLLTKQVTEGLSPAEQRELDVLDSAVASEYLRDLERAAAAVSLAGTPWVEPPPALLATIAQQADWHFASDRDAKAAAAAPPDTIAPQELNRRARSGSRSSVLGWFAAAACLVLALFGWFRPQAPTVAPVADVHVTVPPAVIAPAVPAAPPTPAEERTALLASPDSVKVTLGVTKDPDAAGVTGDVVWDPVTQRGYLHFVGLATNDPQVRQYQLWIFDAKRDQRYPVDGGVFDVPADSSDVVIPIHAALPISVAKAFAVTVEQPGGVVVPALGHVLAMGAAGA
jgi:hypothetical protein